METNIYQTLTIRTPIIVRPNPEFIYPSWHNKNFRYDGTVKSIKEQYVNQDTKNFVKERVVYVGFIDKCVYDKILIQGSKIMCYIHNNLLNCFILNIMKDASGIISKMQVAIYDDDDIQLPYPITYTTYTIDTSKIDSMLITDKTYIIQKL
jgi:hypothetical protein